MLKKYYKKIDKKEFSNKPSMEEHQKKFDNFCDTIIDINWNKILYNRMSFISLAIQKFKLKQFNDLNHPAKPRWSLDEDATFLKGAGIRL